MDWIVFGFILVRVISWCSRGKHLTPAVIGNRGHFIMSLFLLRIADRVTCRVRGKFLVGVGGGGGAGIDEGAWPYIKYLLVKPLHPNISLHILHTVLYTFAKVLTR